jgi:hypothetical protein
MQKSSFTILETTSAHVIHHVSATGGPSMVPQCFGMANRLKTSSSQSSTTVGAYRQIRGNPWQEEALAVS